MAKLTDKQKQFCEEYLIDLNATQAAIRAGYSKKTAQEISAQNLSKLIIQEYLSELKAKRAEKIEITQDEVLRELKNFAYADITDIMNLSFAEIKQLPIELRRMISSYKKTETSGDGWEKISYEIKFVDKMKAIEMINRHIGLYEKDNVQSRDNIIINKPNFDD